MMFRPPEYNRKEEKKKIDAEDMEHIKARDSLLMDYWMGPGHTYRLQKSWTDLSDSWIYKADYLKADKFQTDLKLAGTRVFVRFHGWTKCDAAQYGNRMSSAVLYDYLTSDSGARFISGMTKISFAPIDLKMLLLVLPIIGGIILGMVYFMG